MAATNNDLYRRADDQDRGRHLVAAYHLERGRLILAERPLLALQSLENLCHNQVCHGCKSFLGGGGFHNPNPTVTIVPCRHLCGHVFCSEACERDTYALHHKYLCTGPATSADDPVVQFKQFSVETNEILLLVAEWWISQHATPGDTTPYTDFCMHPWWDVVAQGLSPSERETIMDVDGLQQQLRSTCDTAAELLNQVFVNNGEIPAISAWDISIRIGACEQNAMGVRQRSPWCRMVFDREFREKNMSQLIANLQEAGFLEEENDDQEDDECHESTCSSSHPADTTDQESNSENEVDMAMDELSNLILDLRIDEDGSVRDLAVPTEQQVVESIGDDLDLIFAPLDGTAMFSTACKMNHSCDPNVMVVYRRQPGWGQGYPLAAFCIALRDISEGEELTISYIDSNESFEERSQALRNYGFECNCRRCKVDRLGIVEDGQETDATTDVFGDDSDSDAASQRSIEETIETTAEERLQDRLNRLDSAVNCSRFGWVPMSAHGSVSSFVMRSRKSVLSEDVAFSCDDPIPRLLGSCSDALQGRDYCLAKIVGLDLEVHLMSILKRNGKWDHPLFRTSYWCASLTLSMGLAHDYNFLLAQQHLDKAIALGLPTEQVEAFMQYVACFSSLLHHGPLYPAFQECQLIRDYRDDDMVAMANSFGLSGPIRNQVQEESELSGEFPSSRYFQRSESVVLRQYASEWPAVEKWRDLSYLARLMGHRVVPIEVGCMQQSSMKESFLSFREFIDANLVSSTQRTVWSLRDCKATSDIAYLAQHPLLSQVPVLGHDFLNVQNLCGSAGPSRVNAWIGTGGTQTPLHFDSYDNLLVQLVGAKYVRLYSATTTEQLYVSTSSSFGAQGNMSSLRCEEEDFVKHPMAKDISYTETVLYPGDVLFIPSGMWHYVRSLSTSISINFWF